MRSLALILSLCLLGCGGSSSSNSRDPKANPSKQTTGNTPAPDRESLKTDLLQLGMALQMSSQNTGKFAKDLNELKPFAQGGERLFERINSGKVTVNWGAKLPANWYAYETDALQSGGMVVVFSPKPVDSVVEKSAAEVKSIVGK